MEIECMRCDDVIICSDWDDARDELIEHMIGDHNIDPNSDIDIEHSADETTISFIEPDQDE